MILEHLTSANRGDAVSEKEKCEPEAPPASELPKQSGKEVRVRYWDSPPPAPTGKEIHPRQHIPPVPEGDEVPDDSPTPPVGLE